MKCIVSHSNDPYFNLAAEEYLLKKYSDNFYFQYINNRSVVIGKHQNAMAEMDYAYLMEHSIKLARRISGGGAVYHDQGNLNYSFITTETPGDFIKFKKYTAPIISALKVLGVDASLGKRNEILVGDRKISGTASHVFKVRVLHHGTLLYNADLEKLARCLYTDASAFKDKAVKSIRSDVVNVRSLINNELSVKSFSEFLFTHILESDPANEDYSLSESDLNEIEKLQNEKFVTWEWNYGYSPGYELSRMAVIDNNPVNIHVKVNKGNIEQIGSMGLDDRLVQQLNEFLVDTKHEPESVKSILSAEFEDIEIQKVLLNALF